MVGGEAVMKRKKHRIKQSLDDRIFDIICHTLLLLLIAVVFYPIYFVLIASFSDPNIVNSGTFLLWPKGFNLIGYERVFSDKQIWIGYANTIFYTVLGTIVGTSVTMLAGYAFSRKDLPGVPLIMLLFVFTMYFSGGTIPTYLTIDKLGLVNTRFLIVVYGCVSVYNIIIVRSFMKSNIPDELYEAATIDGCGNARFFTQIVLPLSKAVVAIIALYIAVSYWNSYFTSMIYLTDASKQPLQLYLRSALLMATNLGSSMMEADPETALILQEAAIVIKYAAIVVSTVPILCVYPFIQKYFVKGVMIGSVKG